MKRTLLALTLTLACTAAFAITREEMESARVQAAKLYLRYANNGSGYLDNTSVSTMADLEKAVAPHATDKTNLDKFKSAVNPSDYASWDKAKAVAYFSEEIFKGAVPNPSSGASMMKSAIKKKVNAMSFSAPSSAKEEPAAKAEEPKNDTQDSGNDPVSLSNGNDASAETEVVEDITADEDTAAVVEPTVVPAEKPAGGHDYTWIYIILLVAIVGVAAWLIYYASKVMKNNERDDDRSRDREDYDVADSHEYKSLERENESLRDEIDSLKDKLRQAKRDLENANEKIAALEADRPRQRPLPRSGGEERVIWLGRVNADGIFVRADKNYNPEATLFRLVTTDGFSGSFYFADEPEAVKLAISNPRRMLAGGCICHNMEDTEGVRGIVTDNAGTAIFESGCWKMLRKAKVSYV